MATLNGSPASLAPQQPLTPAAISTINKPLAPMPGSLPPTTTFTMKEWIIPPRPKPGRKPAVDAPPTKRKAQNREAQRAFRERRAAKVGDLEEQMKLMEEEDCKEQEDLRSRIRQLEKDVDDYSKLLVSFRAGYQEMEAACDRERQLRQIAEDELMALRRGQDNVNEAVPLPPIKPVRNGYTNEQQSGAKNDITSMGATSCGRCTSDTRCACIEEAFEMSNVESNGHPSNFKRPLSPPSNTDNKRVCQNGSKNDYENTEIDFTAQFASRRPPTFRTSASASSSTPATAPDPCGFCQDGTHCICAELSAQRPLHHESGPALKSQLPASVPLRARSSQSSCNNDPGTCSQCRSNPTSTLFCQTLAATRSSSSTNNMIASNGITAVSNTSHPPPQPPFMEPKGLTLTCADTFTTLSRHPAFSKASAELGAWVPQLAAVPGTTDTKGRTAFEIEAASVMGVLKFFDRRFGAGL